MRKPTRALAYRLTFALVLLAIVSVACVATRPPIDPRFLAVHNAFSAMGMAQVGPVQQGSLVEGREARLSIDLGAQCTTLVAMGGDGVRDLDLSLLDTQGNVLARDVTHDPQAVLRLCVDVPGWYTLLVRMAAGSGDFLVATWSGGSAAAGPAGSAALAASGRGNCDAPIPIAPGTINGNTSSGESQNTCNGTNAEGRELVYRLEIPSRKKLTIEVKARYDAVLYVRREVCDSDDEEYEVKCNDDETNNDQNSSRIDAVVEAGTYFVFVDGVQDNGAFTMNVTTQDVPSLADVCRQSRPLTTSGTVSGTTTSSYDHVHASCGDDAKGNDAPHRFDLGQRSRVRFTHHSDDYTPIVHVRSVCTDEQTEVACFDTDSAIQDDESVFVGVLDPGSYTVFADNSDEETSGRYTLDAEVGPEAGSGTTGDSCADAVPLPPNDASIDGDTFTAKDDIAGKCGGTGAADVVYRIDLAKRSRISAQIEREEGVTTNGNAHVFVLQRSCADKTSELACGESVDEVLQPGTYFLTVDGTKPDRFGKFTINWSVRDVSGQENACKTAPSLVDGQTVSGNTTGGSDKFSTSCGGERIGASNDRLYKIVVGTRERVRLALSTPTWDGVLAIRKACLDPAGSTSSRQAEMACNNDAEDAHHARLETTLDPGTYFVLVDGHRAGQDGAYTLEYHVVK
ncbi:hypothetical protein BH09MYX1_BH09MYX1_21980 [soil metagenome]